MPDVYNLGYGPSLRDRDDGTMPELIDVVVHLRFIALHTDRPGGTTRLGWFIAPGMTSLVELLEPGALDFLRVGAILRCEHPPTRAIDLARRAGPWRGLRDGSDGSFEHVRERIEIATVHDVLFGARGTPEQCLTVIRGVQRSLPQQHDERCDWRLTSFTE